ncbi:MAG: RNA ligase [Deltaproteobacteria bacterium]|nr:RNA ligase [Deltaproteobacteria bacterium]|tara:strand:+ start:12378 stop:13436 length:1059 start_codon:yes stop_codon:yes gene_type:complete
MTAQSPFLSYEKIVESPKKWRLDEKETRALDKQTWVVTEKIHGAHFCFVIEEDDVSAAKRKAFLDQDDDFFGYEDVYLTYADACTELFAQWKRHHPHTTRLYLYGELFGGDYPHPEVPSNENVQAIQTGVYYAPDIHFCAFDLAYTDADATKQYVDFDTFAEQLDHVGIMRTQALFEGKWADALSFDVTFTSTIPSRLGLPPLQQDNLAEGVVIKPKQPLFVTGPKGPFRPVLKQKIASFAEDRRFHQAQKWEKKHPHPSYEQNVSPLEQTLLQFVTPTRLDNVLSKMGRVAPHQHKKRQQLLKAFEEDVWEALTEEAPEQVTSMRSDEEVRLREVVQVQCEQCIEAALSSR